MSYGAQETIDGVTEALKKADLSSNGTLHISATDPQHRSNSVVSQSAATPLTGPANELYNTAIRHGFAADYDSDKFLQQLAEVFFIYFEDKRHETGANPRQNQKQENFNEWRIRDRQRTVNAAIVLCLNIGVDPPDVIKTHPCARLEAWIDPQATSDPKKAIEQIGKQLQAQYEVLSTRTKYKLSLDPNVEDCKKFCMSLRRSARDERILFHYNGHGVPRPTPSGEIWVFNRGYTQYIPVSVYDLQSWLGAPCIFCCDCNAAGHIVTNFNKFVQKRKQDELVNGRDPSMPPAEAFENCIQLAACRENETLPMNPDLPADLFTCCITSPIDIAIKWFVLQYPHLRGKLTNLTIPGKITDRRTPLGELNWIFTAITDTIAWSSLEGPLFKRLFRQDLVVAAMFRNFLLATRIMRPYNCHPVSSPAIPDTHNHPMWDSWDLAVDQCLAQLPILQAQDKTNPQQFKYQHSTFFEQQLTAFEMWLKYRSKDLDEGKPPEQLPVLLQVLLSQIHRLRALVLLSKYLDIGPKAVHSALSIGIFPYVLKLLQSPAPELKPVLVFIWARIMAVDYKNIQHELIKENGYRYFTSIFTPLEGVLTPTNSSFYEHLAMCAFVTTLFCKGFVQGQRLCLDDKLLLACVSHSSSEESPILRQWSCLLLAQLWDDSPEAKALGVKEDICYKICRCLNDPVPEVRTSCLVALTTFLGSHTNPAEIPEDVRQREISLTMWALSKINNDASTMVRRELVVFLSKFVKSYLSYFVVCAYSHLKEEVSAAKSQFVADTTNMDSPANGTTFLKAWHALLILSEDPYIEVAEFAQDVVDFVMMKLDKTPLVEEVAQLESFLTKHAANTAANQNNKHENSVTHDLHMIHKFDHSNGGTKANRTVSNPVGQTNGHGNVNTRRQASESHSDPQAQSYLHSTYQRSVSFANSLKNFALGVSTSTDGQNDHPPASERHNRSKGGNVEFGGAKWEPPIMETSKSVTNVAYGVGKQPIPVRYTPKDYSKKIVLPLKSGFFEWCCEYFQEPQMCQADSEEPGSERYNERLWRKSRNEQIMAETQLQKNLSVQGTWNTQTGFLNNVTQPKKMLFSQFENHLVVCDDRDGVTIWDWAENTRLNRICNGNPVDSRITEAKFLNEDDHPLLLTGSSDGVVKIYREYESPRNVKLTCSWRVLADLIPNNRTSGLVAEWQQSRGTLLVSGDARIIRVWDAPRELCIYDIPVRTGSPVTSLTSDQVSGHIIAAGFGDGAVRVYDRRLDNRSCMVKAWKHHDSWILNTRMQRGGARELVTGSTDGVVNIWDIRLADPVLSFQRDQRGGGMKSMDVHEHAPVIATSYQNVEVWSTKGTKVSLVKSPTSNSSYLSSNNVPYVSGLTFHPHRMILAVNSSHDSHVSVFSCTPRLRT